MTTAHNFHIPVLGIGYTIDTPAKVAPFGISSVVSLVDDLLVEKMREFYCTKFKLPFKAIGRDEIDYRAKRITAYLNVLNIVVQNKFVQIKNSTFEKGGELYKYLEMAFENSKIKQMYLELKETAIPEKVAEIQDWIREHLPVGSIDVNIMTKLDKANYKDGEKLPVEFNDAHAALRGFAQSALDGSSLVLSAGINQHLYSYIAEFEDFFPDENGYIKKKIILKVSDYRSALIQGKLLAKKGLWVSDFRVESGLNCGGHAFPTEGHLMGPILEEFKQNRDDLKTQLNAVYKKALEKRGLGHLGDFDVQITAQGGVGTANEHKFLLDYYGIDSVGWGSAFLLVPEATNVDEHTLELLANAKEDDYYLSGISPLGVPFNNIRGNSKDIEKDAFIAAGTPGSPCSKDHLALNNEFGERALCTASRKYQTLKIEEINASDLSAEQKNAAIAAVVEKACICVGLGTAALTNNELDTKIEGTGVSICPGPSLVSFDRTYSLEEMTDHIYGRTDLLAGVERPHFFVRELKMYEDYLLGGVNNLQEGDEKQKNYFAQVGQNMLAGIEYYLSLFPKVSNFPEAIKVKSLEICAQIKQKIEGLGIISEAKSA
ncbi:MAG: hypothetical protein FWE23_02910 [Chitinivibrionia bacterium]|nr:hypothetical protein [Chitinivibrionia bacterium]